MTISARPVSVADISDMRELYRAEMNCQIVHDNMHYRTGWTETYLLEIAGESAGYGSILVAGPWTGTRTAFEFVVLPAHRTRAFALFDDFLAASRADAMEIQSNDTLITAMFHTFAHDIATEKIVFADSVTTHLLLDGSGLPLDSSGLPLDRSGLPLEGVTLRQRPEPDNDWVLESGGVIAATGGILYHYNRPYGDIYMEVAEPFRRRGFGSYLVQELKRVCYESGSIPAARCSPDNVASRKTLQKAGFVPYANILTGKL
jgi:hypothetical protein